MIKLDERLSAIAALVRKDKRICDIGTDHALLPCYLAQNGAASVIASDVNPNPLEAARANVEKYGCGEAVTLVLSDGLKDIPPCDDVIIAGMGGELIAEIIAGCTFVTPDTRFILQPMTRAEHLRRYLYGAGYEIMLENGAYSGGKAYTVILARYTGEKREISDELAYFGKSTDERYIAKVNGQLEKLSRSDPGLSGIIKKSRKPMTLSGEAMNELCEMIKRQTDANFLNLITAIKTYDRNAAVCGAPAWRYVYHTIHSADKWFFNPYVFDEPEFHKAGMDNPNAPCDIELTDEQLLDYLEKVRQKTADYLDTLTDEMLGECPEKCDKTRLELILMQFRHISTHIGMLNGLTIEKTGKFPVYVTPSSLDRLKNGYYEF